ncbi:nucleotidyltransferase family protein [Paenibacillus endoradicis]|uniref:nucleotidyltransferase family protein n=1 Tax=Paenibacillus endoradicis TaxID=2972487 RepID=UPI002158F8CF|nr:nucleotidyltransferase family protein [Paenibacillus endoradicis]MCR8656670.1 nucleotidyltransferase family protein [Paenibacillus endoradicis]
MLKQRLIEIMLRNDELIEDLTLVRDLNLPNSWIAAGYVRNYCWDSLHEYHRQSLLEDVDIIYYDQSDLTFDKEIEYEEQLKLKKSTHNWSIKNQARMHITNNTKPYVDIEDAMRHWPETATAVGIRMNWENDIQVIAPLGLEDLFDLKIRKSTHFQDVDYFHNRINSKNWLHKWPKLRIVE